MTCFPDQAATNSADDNYDTYTHQVSFFQAQQFFILITK